jgi:hypothetical protein
MQQSLDNLNVNAEANKIVMKIMKNDKYDKDNDHKIDF